MIVIDACVALKWFFDEVGSEEASRLLDRHAGQIRVPDLFPIEVAGALVREANAGKQHTGSVTSALELFLALGAESRFAIDHTTTNRLAQSAAIAIDLRHPLKDCLYLGLAMELGCPLVTADERFARRAREIHASVELLSAT
jgi:predicted nucleic acid-binding protein